MLLKRFALLDALDSLILSEFALRLSLRLMPDTIAEEDYLA